MPDAPEFLSDAAQAAIDNHTVTEITDRAFREEVSADIRASIAASKARYGPHRTTRPVRLEFNGVKHPVELDIRYVFHPSRFTLNGGDLFLIGQSVKIISTSAYDIRVDVTDLLGKPLLDALAADILRECK